MRQTNRHLGTWSLAVSRELRHPSRDDGETRPCGCGAIPPADIEPAVEVTRPLVEVEPELIVEEAALLSYAKVNANVSGVGLKLRQCW